MADIGLIGLGTMGAALALNIAEKGTPIAVFNRTTSRTEDFAAAAGPLAPQITPCTDLQTLVDAITPPRAIILMVPAGKAVDAQIAALAPLLGPEDLVIDAGNANFNDTRRRAAEITAHKFLGIGVSGGEEGARHGPSIMGGGDRLAWDRVAPILEAISAKYQGRACATWMGTDGAGHFVKTVHNGIEYADMQMIAETYGVMRDGLGMSPDEIAEVYERWNTGPLQSYLIEISGKVARAQAPGTGGPLLDVILDTAGQKGTGRWTAIEALLLAAPATAIEAAVAARNLSAQLEVRAEGTALFGAAPVRIEGDRTQIIAALEPALLAGKIACYAQGFGLLAAASSDYGWDLPLPAIAEVWRAGCIIRSAMLDDMARALQDPATSNLMFAPGFTKHMRDSEGALRQTVALGAMNGLAMPALSAALSYFDTLRTERGTANMIQGQRDFFGLHGFRRRDMDGDHHGPWA